MDGVKRWLGDLTAWIGFSALIIGPLPCLIIYPVVALGTFMRGPSVTRKSCPQWLEILDAEPRVYDPFVPSDIPRGFDFISCTEFGSYWEYSGNNGWVYHTSSVTSGQIVAQIPEYESAWQSAGDTMRGQITGFSVLWTLVLTINCVFWDRFRVLPWK